MKMAAIVAGAVLVSAQQTHPPRAEPTECESAHQIQEVARLVTATCQGQDGVGAGASGLLLPDHCTPECASVYTPWYGDEGDGSCFAALGMDERAAADFKAFAAVCRGDNTQVDPASALYVTPADGSGSALLCFEAVCATAPILVQQDQGRTSVVPPFYLLSS
jgi:hypothetical protein